MKLEKEIERGKSIYKGNSSNALIGTCTCYVLHLVREVGARGSSLALSWHSYGSIYLSMVVVMMPVVVVVVTVVVGGGRVLVVPHGYVLLVVVVLPRPRGDRETHGFSDVWWNALC